MKYFLIVLFSISLIMVSGCSSSVRLDSYGEWLEYRDAQETERRFLKLRDRNKKFRKSAEKIKPKVKLGLHCKVGF